MTETKMIQSTAKRGSKLALIAGIAVVVAGGAAWATGGKSRGHLFDYLDADHNNQITSKEIEPLTKRRFARYDIDGDGKVTGAEIEEVLRKRLERRRDRILKRFDADADGVITQSEVDAHVSKEFARADTNGDGSISRDEARELRKNRHERWRRHWEKHHDE